MQVKFYDLQKINNQWADELSQVAMTVIDSGHYIRGNQVRLFEINLAEYIGVKYAIGVGNGYDALYLILRAYIELGALQAGDEVIVPANTFVATVLAITANGLKPVLIEPDIRSYNLNVSQIKWKLTSRTKVIIPVHLYGQACWDETFRQIAYDHNLIFIEDNAQAFGARWNGARTGSLGKAVAFSFYPTKNLGALGDGGAVTTNNTALASMVRALANYGSEQKYKYEVKGINSRLDEMQAAFLNVKLKYVDDQNKLRANVAAEYCMNISNCKITLPVFDTDCVWHQFVIRTKNRDQLQSYLSLNGIETMVHYPIAPHEQYAYEELKDIILPVTEQLSREVLSLPISPVMTGEEVQTVIKAINKWKG
jgi:dTDP-4-amino-4,6-dideoxygalactose transaminase